PPPARRGAPGRPVEVPRRAPSRRAPRRTVRPPPAHRWLPARRAGRSDGSRDVASRLQEERLAVRAVDGGVAAGAVAEARLHVTRRRRRVTLVAELRHLLVAQEV